MSGRNVEEILANLNLLCDCNDEKANRFKELKTALEEFSKNKSINYLIDFTHDIYNKINWEKENDEKISIANGDYRVILIHLLNIFIAENRKANITDFDRTSYEFDRIVKIIDGFRR